MRFPLLRFCVGLLLVTGMFVPLPAAAQVSILTPQPIIYELGSPGISETVAYALNDRGQVVLSAWSAGGGRASVWENGRLSTLPVPPGFIGESRGFDINNRGQVVGEVISQTVDSGSRVQAVLWQNGTMTDLGLLGDGGDTYPLHINEAGQIIGVSEKSIPAGDP